jgi:diguanylate cyclase (GGDEF)-like protein
VKALIVDDELLSQRLLSRTLTALSYETVVAGDGLAAWEKFQSDAFQLVITDWEMPGLNGAELCGRIRGAHREAYTYVILLTSHRDREYLLGGLAAGADEFLLKPFDPDELRMRLRVAERIINLEADLREANRRLRMSNLSLERTSRLDSLMEIGNRLAFEETVEDLHANLPEAAARHAVVMCDVDSFKSCNDQYGHQLGDEVLRGVAAVIRDGIRKGDLAYRYGGDEIVVLLQKEGLEEAAAAAERLRRAVEPLEFPVPEGSGEARVTLSCGVAASGSNPQGADLSLLIELADKALYEAKARGRNRVIAVELEPDGSASFFSVAELQSRPKRGTPRPQPALPPKN